MVRLKTQKKAVILDDSDENGLSDIEESEEQVKQVPQKKKKIETNTSANNSKNAKKNTNKKNINNMEEELNEEDSEQQIQSKNKPVKNTKTQKQKNNKNKMEEEDQEASNEDEEQDSESEQKQKKGKKQQNKNNSKNQQKLNKNASKPQKKAKSKGEDSDFEVISNDESDQASEEYDDGENENVSDEESYDVKEKSKNNKKKQQNKTKSSASKSKADSQSNIDGEDDTFYENATGSIEEKFELPDFMLPENIMDAEKRKLNHKDYNPSTLYIPEKYLKKESPMFKQYWEAKKQNYNKIVLFRFGRNFMVFYEDSFIIHKLMGSFHVKNWGKRPFINLWDSQLPLLLKTLMQHGYQCAIVDQITSSINKVKDEISKREVTQIITRGTYTDFGEDQEYDPRYIMSIIESSSEGSFGVCIVESSTNTIHLDEFKDDKLHTNLRTLIKKLKPVEIIFDKDNLSGTVKNMCKQICNPAFSRIDIDFVKIKDALNYMKSQFEEAEFPQPPLITELIELYEQDNEQFKIQKENAKQSGQMEEEDEEGDNELDVDYQYYMMVQALMMAVNYLDKTMLSTVYKMSTYKIIDSSIEKEQFLHMDAHALENLDILEVCQINQASTEKGSLLNYLDYTVSAFGKRQLKKWVQQPLKNVLHIQDRLNTVEDLLKHSDLRATFQSHLKKLPDLERMTSRIYNSLQAARLKSSSFDNFPAQRLVDLVKLLKDFSKVPACVEVFKEAVNELESSRLRGLVSVRDENQRLQKKKQQMQQQSDKKQSYLSIYQQKPKKKKEVDPLFPDIQPVLDELQGMVNEDNEGFIEPRAGLNEQYDAINKNIKKIKTKLQNNLEYWKKELKCTTIKYTHSHGVRYQLEIPNAYIEGNKRPAEFILIGKVKAAMRFQTEEIEEYIIKLKELEEKLQEQLIPFVLQYITEFYKHKDVWFSAISCLAELDCYCSLAKCSSMMEIYCKPEFTEQKGVFELRGMHHPTLQKAGNNMVPNDTVFEKGTLGLLVTGPNMGGKSTLLRQTCLAVILAQIGCYIPATSFKLNPVDRIFCRIGANDKLLEGKSTFFVEMEETQVIVNEATSESLVLLDELGRGTSTYDGVSIAYAVLKHLMDKSKCKCLFATHYHMLLDYFRLFSNIQNYKMGHEYNEEEKKLEFSYKFIKGESDRSFAVNCAKIVGMNEQIQNRALEMDQKLNGENEKLGLVRRVNQDYNNIIQSLFQNQGVEGITSLTKKLKV